MSEKGGSDWSWGSGVSSAGRASIDSLVEGGSEISTPKGVSWIIIFLVSFLLLAIVGIMIELVMK